MKKEEHTYVWKRKEERKKNKMKLFILHMYTQRERESKEICVVVCCVLCSTYICTKYSDTLLLLLLPRFEKQNILLLCV